MDELVSKEQEEAQKKALQTEIDALGLEIEAKKLRIELLRSAIDTPVQSMPSMDTMQDMLAGLMAGVKGKM